MTSSTASKLSSPESGSESLSTFCSVVERVLGEPSFKRSDTWIYNSDNPESRIVIDTKHRVWRQGHRPIANVVELVQAFLGLNKEEAALWLREGGYEGPEITTDQTPCKQHLPLDLRLADAMQPNWPHLSEKGRPRNHSGNLAYMLEQYGVSVRYNEMLKDIEIKLPFVAHTLDNRSNCSIAEIQDLCAINGLPTSRVPEQLLLIADSNAYHPVRDWIESHPWDGTSRLAELCNTIETTMSTDYRDMILKRWLLSAVALLYAQKPTAAHGVLVLVGPQGLGKTSWLMNLAPVALDAVNDGQQLDPSNKDLIAAAIRYWIVELGEIGATFRKADISRLKAFLTQRHDEFRRAYARTESKYPRRTVFAGSVNENEYLVDETGNRRWWTLAVKSLKHDHAIDMQQLWAEVLELYQAGEQWWLTASEMEQLNEVNKGHESIDYVAELIESTFDWDKEPRDKWSISQIIDRLSITPKNAATTRRVSSVLRDRGFEIKKSNGSKYFLLPPRKNDFFLDEEEDDRPEKPSAQPRGAYPTWRH